MANQYKFSDIPQYTRGSCYHINCGWSYLEELLNGYIKESNLNLDPDFQRAHVWDENKQKRYVEYVLRGGSSGKELYFNCVNWSIGISGEFVIVDGKQRLEAVRKFMRNELEIFDNGLIKNKKPLKFSDFGEKLRITKADFQININDLATRKEVLQWYLDLNEGGVVHTSEELNKVKKLLAHEDK